MAASFATQTEAEAGVEGLPPADDGSLFNGEIFGALASQSSFPLRLVYGERRDDGWIQLPLAATQPKALQRRYTANGCEFALTAEAFGVRLMKKTDDGFVIEKDSLGPQNILDVSKTEPLHVTLVSELNIKMAEGSEAACRKLFAGKKLRFAAFTLDGGSVYAESRGGNRLTAETMTLPEAVEAYLSWDERNKTLRVTDRAGLAAALESAVYALPAAKHGMYYFSYEPAWKVERFGGGLASK